MFRKALTVCIYSVYNICKLNIINRLYSEILFAVNCNKSRKHAIEAYIKYWNSKGLNLKLITTKKDIISFQKRKPIDGVYSWAYTGGSYGEPLKVPYSIRRSFIRTATFKYFNEKGGYKLGDPFALIRAKDKSYLEKYFRNETILIPVDLSDSKLHDFVTLLIKKKVKTLLGYPTVMFELAMFLDKHPELKSKLYISNLISTSEMLDINKRKVVMEVFNASFVDRYANEEVGLIAQQETFDGDYIVNPYNVIVEVVNTETLKSVPEGTIGKVLVTDISNDLVPMYRYDTGDLAIAGSYLNGELRSIKKIIGRESEKIFDVEGNPVSSLTLGPSIYKPLSNEDELYQFQFAQTDNKSYELRLKSTAISIPSTLKDSILINLKKQLGSEADILITKVSDIPPQPSGKRPVYKNEMRGYQS